MGLATHSITETPIAIIGMACRVPGADNLEQFWQLVREGRNALGPVPAERLDRARYYDPQVGVCGKTYTDLAGLVDYRPVDRRVCPITDETEASHDVAHVTLCEVAALACRDARFDPTALPYANTGVYVGHAAASGLGGRMNYATTVAETAEYLREVEAFSRLSPSSADAVIRDVVHRVRSENPHRHPDGSPYLGACVAAGLISRAFGLDGPYMAFNAACASSLQALAQAMRALQTGRTDMAIVGGASYFHSDTLVLFSQARSVSVSGSHPFTADADGMVVGEGYVAVILKTLERAVADGDPIRAVLRGIGISSDGRGKSLWAPRAEGQIEAMRRAYGPAVSIDRLQYIEAHATSTALGDATELETLGRVLDSHVASARRIAVGSAKFNVGHTLEAAGLVGLAKTVLALQHRVIPPATDGRPLNPKINWERLPVDVPSHSMDWSEPSDGGPRRAGVNAFGIGGLNVHAVVDEYQPIRGVSVAIPRSLGRVSPAARQPRHADQAVAIVGMGAVLPGARTLKHFWNLVTSGRDAKGEVSPSRWHRELYGPQATPPWTTPSAVGGFITDFAYDWRKHKIPPKQIAQASPLQFMILDAVDQAFQHAGVAADGCDRRRVGAVVGTIFGGDFASQLSMGLRIPEFRTTLEWALLKHGVPSSQAAEIVEAYVDVFFRHMPALLDETGSFTASGLASRITKAFDLMGGAVAVDAGTASSTAALECCTDLLVSGTCDLMICVGAQQDMAPGAFVDRAMCGLLAAGPPVAPFDASASGIVPGEGCGVLLLKRLADAERAGDTVHGVIRAVGSGFSRSRAQAVALAAARAFHAAGLQPDDIAAIETTGLGRAEADAEEIEGVAQAYAERGNPIPLRLGTLAAQIGHLGGASGMVSLLKATMELQHGSFPRPFAWQQPAPFLDAHRSLLAVSTSDSLSDPVSGEPTAPPARYAAVSSCGGIELVHHVLLERGTVMLSPTPQTGSSESRESTRVHGQSGEPFSIIHFDATLPRRERMRRQATAGVVVASSASVDAPPTPSSDTQVAPPAPETAPTLPPAEPASGHRCPPSDLANFLIDFVVQRTEYPPDIVDLTADLEADLGIDFFKKAQILAELNQHFALRPDDCPAPDDFSTLQEVLDYLSTSMQRTGETPDATATPAEATAPPMPAAKPAIVEQPVTAPAASVPETTAQASSPGPDPAQLAEFLVNFVVEQTGYPAEIVELDADLEADLGIDSIKKAQLFGELGEYFDVQPAEDLTLDDFPTLQHVLDYLIKGTSGTAQPQEALSVPAVTRDVSTPTSAPPGESAAGSQPEATAITFDASPPAPAANNAPDVGQMAEFLVNFVVEQTGYPAEIVELDADLEADLGIDSIKKAQLFGELGEYFDVQPAEDLTLDDFPTLQHVLDYLNANVSEAGAPTAADAPRDDAEEPAAVTAAPTVEQTNAAASTSPAAAGSSTTGVTPAADQMSAFLVNFVVEQTGYPAEIVELDADLEADLGIDSIKKAQLFGELGEYFDVQPAEDLTLDDFPTLQHVLDYLIENVGAGEAVVRDERIPRQG